MDKITIFFAVIRTISHVWPKKQPPSLPPLSQLYWDSYNSIFPGADNAEAPYQTTVRDVTDEGPKGATGPGYPYPSEAQITGVATACMNCARSHLATVTGAWEEALRFARTNGIGDPEVVKRLAIAEKELNIMERVDLSPASIEASPKEQQALARKFLPAFRELRQKAGEIATVSELEKAAADAENTGRQLRMDILQSKGVDVKGIANLVQRVEKREITIDQAKAELHKMVPR
jgi:hypothetical protein